MSAFLGQLGPLLTSAPGSLLYQLVLAFSIAATLQAAITGWRARGQLQDRRAVWGLGAMLALLCLHFLLGIIAVGTPGLEASLPAADRAITAILLLGAIWLWRFPAASRQADLGTMVIAAAIGIAGILIALLFGGGTNSTGFNHTIADTIWQLGTIALVGIGGTLLFIRRTDGR